MESVPKIELFLDVGKLIDVLSSNEIKGFRPWRFDGYKWVSFSDYYLFGTRSASSKAQNNLAYYISSDVPDYTQELKLVLNINNPEENKEATDTFIRIALKTFSALELIPPRNMLSAVASGKEFEHDEDLYKASLKILKTSIYSWSLLIRSK